MLNSYIVGDSFEPCPSGTIIVKPLAGGSLIVRVPGTTDKGFVYSNASVLDTSDLA